ncbi:MAG: histidine kinase [Actinomycetota bacterium]
MGLHRLFSMRTIRELPPVVADGALALVIFVIALTLEVPTRAGIEFRDHDALWVVLIALMTLPVALRRISPEWTIVVTGLSTTAYYPLGYPDSIASLGVLVALYSLAAHSKRRVSLQGLAISFVCIAVSIIGSPEPLTAQLLISNYIVFGTAWVIGDNVRHRRAYTAELEAHAARLESEREENARRAVDDERQRIAREMHDVVAHNVSVMVVQAGAARRVLDANPEQAREALTSIETTGRQALAQMRRLLGVLREDDEAARHLAPQPTMAALETLLEQAREAGLPVELEVQGRSYPLPDGIDLSAYRIVQEALTNSLKHAGPTRALVRLIYSPGAFELSIVDDGHGAATQMGDGEPLGHGLVGMRERVALFGGELHAGPRRGGGFEVRARLPLEKVAT